MLRNLAYCALAALLVIGAAAGEAARVTPMAVELKPIGRNSIARIEVTNNENRDLPVEIRLYRGIISETGELSLEPADDKFVAFPPQVVIAANAQQVFRIQYIADGPLAQSEIYYASISQLPVDVKPTVSRIEVLMRFNVLVNVVPDGTKADPKVSSVRVAEREIEVAQPPPSPGTPASSAPTGPRMVKASGVEVRIENQGNRYFAAGRADWTVSGTDEAGAAYSETFKAAQIGDSIGMGVVAPGRARIFFLPLDRRLRTGTVSVSLGR